jgi:hypothetical protein
MPDRTEIETAAVARFLETGFPKGFAPGRAGKEEVRVIDGIVRYVEDRFKPLTYVLNLALDFTLVAQKLSAFDLDAKSFRPDVTEAGLFAKYPKAVARGAKADATLTLTVRHADKVHRVGIRRVEEDVCDLFIACDRTGFTSAYIYNTGKWPDHVWLLAECVKLSEAGRHLLCNRLIDFGLVAFAVNSFYGRDTPRPRLFEVIVRDYERTARAGENAGMVMQGVAYGFFKADRT